MFYAYRITSWKNEAGGWVNLALGKRPDEPIYTPRSSKTAAAGVALSLEDKVRDLADELGIHPRELASAIRPLVPPATVSSVSAAKPTGTVLSVLAEDDEEDPTAPSVLEKVAGLGGLVGNEEPFEAE